MEVATGGGVDAGGCPSFENIDLNVVVVSFGFAQERFHELRS